MVTIRRATYWATVWYQITKLPSTQSTDRYYISPDESLRASEADVSLLCFSDMVAINASSSHDFRVGSIVIL
jgi:hypothetical protein